MLTWDEFLAIYQRPHLLVGWTQGGRKWRDNSLLQWIDAQRLSGQYSFKRDYEPQRERYVILKLFESEADARRLASLLDADLVNTYGGFASQREYRISSKLLERLSAALGKSVTGSAPTSPGPHV